ncbi:hypothetical protein EB796_002770 [Bugula neritina]|uniref:Uncharacterized protein n=1 Tax=Bugula neritina TaxID=10212 RepID=A0A7J7KJM3_BUGNE|nr:hypothetical protein EB796_024290 [Bugula neritina]KAF6027784.1 hypothetical protein EB796_013904 [Bugula neritina]KAF6038920.1 hypothetical protein EB796_002770 [Bugula neritina]
MLYKEMFEVKPRRKRYSYSDPDRDMDSCSPYARKRKHIEASPEYRSSRHERSCSRSNSYSSRRKKQRKDRHYYRQKYDSKYSSSSKRRGDKGGSDYRRRRYSTVSSCSKIAETLEYFCGFHHFF